MKQSWRSAEVVLWIADRNFCCTRLVFGVERRDVYGRLLAYVYLHGRFFNPILVRRGLARSLTIPPNDRFAQRFRRLELTAARAGRGLWGAC